MALEVHWVSLYRFPGEEKQFFVELECFVWPEEDNERAKKKNTLRLHSFVQDHPEKVYDAFKTLDFSCFYCFPFSQFFFFIQEKKRIFMPRNETYVYTFAVRRAKSMAAMPWAFEIESGPCTHTRIQVGNGSNLHSRCYIDTVVWCI